MCHPEKSQMTWNDLLELSVLLSNNLEWIFNCFVYFWAFGNHRALFHKMTLKPKIEVWLSFAQNWQMLAQYYGQSPIKFGAKSENFSFREYVKVCQKGSILAQKSYPLIFKGKLCEWKVLRFCSKLAGTEPTLWPITYLILSKIAKVFINKIFP